MSRPPFQPALLWPAFHGTVLLALTLRPSPFRRLLFLPISALTVYVARSTTGTFLGDYTIGCAWWGYFWQASDYILVAEPQRELVKLEQRKQDSPPPPPIETQSVFERLRWALSLWLSPRGVGWSHEPTSVLAPAPARGTSRLRFLLGTQLPRGLALLIIHDAANLYTRANALFRAAGGPWESRGWGVRAGMALTFGASGWTGLALAWTAISVVAVAVGLSKPEEWPPLFGGPREAYSVRRFWGRAWHQLLRRQVSSHGKFLSKRVLGLQPGTNASSYTQLYTAFLISGLLHYAAEVYALDFWHGGALHFFLAQAVAITVEDFVKYLGRRAGLGPRSRAVRYLGYLWVTAWFTLSVPWWMNPLARAGMFEQPAELMLRPRKPSITRIVATAWTALHPSCRLQTDFITHAPTHPPDGYDLDPGMSTNVLGVLVIARAGDHHTQPDAEEPSARRHSVVGTVRPPLPPPTPPRDGSVEHRQSDAHHLGADLRARYFSPSSRTTIRGLESHPLVAPRELQVLATQGGGGFESAMALLQGLFPPSKRNCVDLANGTVVRSPLGGYQYVPVETIEPGNDGSLEPWRECPIHEFMQDQLTFNQTFAYRLPPTYMAQARALADWHENAVFSDTRADGIGNIAGRTMMPTITDALQRMAAARDPLKFVAIETTYQPLISLFHQMDMTAVYPELAALRACSSGVAASLRLNKRQNVAANFGASLVIELRRGPPPESLDFVRFRWRNGTEDEDGWRTLRAFGHKRDVPLYEFIYRASIPAISNHKRWARACGVRANARSSDLQGELGTAVQGVFWLDLLGGVLALFLLLLGCGLVFARKRCSERM
ncbi:unnamed protein product [Mycena citricolor]|uniref:Wax synthase domain-containing protein n=1 Tax=Mycena citricolor TaxID=2018698 RepID=A0AAD2I1Z3_9AGAR|nr:unnamed protein product [Mycena citricolor]